MTPSSDLAHDILTLQTLVADHTQTIQDLSHELFCQQKDIARLTEDLKRLKKEIDNSKDQGVFNNEPVKPPHY